MAQNIRQQIDLDLAPAGGTLVLGSGTGTVTGAAISQLDTAAYSGSPTYYFEAVFTGPAGNTGTIKLRDQTGATNVASLAGSVAGAGIAQIARVAFTPTAGAREYGWQLIGDGTHSQNIFAARIIVLQSETAITKTQTQIEIGPDEVKTNSVVADFSDVKFWKYTAANWDGTKTFSVEVTWKTSAKNTCTLTLCRTSDNAANVTLVSAGTNSTGFTRTRVTFTPVDGETYKLRGLGSTTKSNYQVINCKIIVDQSSVTQVTKLEPQMLLLSGEDSGTPGVTKSLNTYNASEWNAGTAGSITITHLMDSDNASNSAKVVTSAGADTATSSAATGTGQQESSAFSLIDATTYDTNVTNSTGIVAASRLKFVYVYVAAAVVIPDLVQQPLKAAGRHP